MLITATDLPAALGCPGLLVYWYIGSLVDWYIGILVYWYFGILVG